MPGDDITNAELARRLDSMRRDFHDDFAEISRRMDSYVLREVYAAERLAMETRVGVLEARVKDGEEQRRTLTRWLISAVVFPCAALIVTIYFNLQGPR
ncbi:hypothetical protein OHB44_28050 [Micromonospora sp. NBC_00821]|uniref:hypothetical protein n=1 Tax=Micromonospora sp. NBC_00821 TaxID=2975977 RepID=UPI002ED07E75|nr:hypothetical protein OHB44_28050 [Micromonospora sp. NBC_00821]